MSSNQELAKSPTGIQGLDEITNGGLPKGRPTLICGGAGSGKTLLAASFLLNGVVQYDEPGILMTFEDTGIAFDPCGRSAAAVPRTLADGPDLVQAPDGGFGLNLVRSVTNSMRYERAADRNRLLVTLRALPNATPCV